MASCSKNRRSMKRSGSAVSISFSNSKLSSNDSGGRISLITLLDCPFARSHIRIASGPSRPQAAVYPAPRADQAYESPTCGGLPEFGGSRSAEFLLQNSTNQSAPCAQFKLLVYMFKRTLKREPLK